MGIDPGTNGGLAILDGNLTVYYKAPIPKTKGKVDLDLLRETLLFWQHKVDLTIIEVTNAFPGQSVASTAKQFQHIGQLQGMLSALWFDYVDVHPRTWTTKLYKGLKGMESKQKALLIANTIFQEKDFHLRKDGSPHDGVTDALLLAYYGCSHLNLANNLDKA